MGQKKCDLCQREANLRDKGIFFSRFADRYICGRCEDEMESHLKFHFAEHQKGQPYYQRQPHRYKIEGQHTAGYLAVINAKLKQEIYLLKRQAK